MLEIGNIGAYNKELDIIPSTVRAACGRYHVPTNGGRRPTCGALGTFNLLPWSAAHGLHSATCGNRPHKTSETIESESQARLRDEDRVYFL